MVQEVPEEAESGVRPLSTPLLSSLTSSWFPKSCRGHSPTAATPFSKSGRGGRSPISGAHNLGLEEGQVRIGAEMVAYVQVGWDRVPIESGFTLNCPAEWL